MSLRRFLAQEPEKLSKDAMLAVMESGSISDNSCILKRVHNEWADLPLFYLYQDFDMYTYGVFPEEIGRNLFVARLCTLCDTHPSLGCLGYRSETSNGRLGSLDV